MKRWWRNRPEWQKWAMMPLVMVIGTIVAVPTATVAAVIVMTFPIWHFMHIIKLSIDDFAQEEES